MSVITQDGNSALIKAAFYGRTEVVVELVKAKANLDLQDKVCSSHHSLYMYIHTCCRAVTGMSRDLQLRLAASMHCVYCMDDVCHTTYMYVCHHTGWILCTDMGSLPG